MEEELDTSTKQISASNFLSGFTEIIAKSPMSGDSFPIKIMGNSKELTRTQKREIILQEIYSYYLAEKDKRKKENWKRYCQWCKDNHKSNTPENVKAFKRSKLYIREVSFVSFKWLIKHIPLEDFYVVLSEVKDRSNRGNNVSSFLGGLWFKNV